MTHTLNYGILLVAPSTQPPAADASYRVGVERAASLAGNVANEGGVLAEQVDRALIALRVIQGLRRSGCHLLPRAGAARDGVDGYRAAIVHGCERTVRF